MADSDVPADEADEQDPHEHHHESIIEELREMPVGVNDPNIIGDAGPLDIPPGSDPHEEGEFTGEPSTDDEDAAG
jgi:hypothetical protein